MRVSGPWRPVPAPSGELVCRSGQPSARLVAPLCGLARWRLRAASGLFRCRSSESRKTDAETIGERLSMKTGNGLRSLGKRFWGVFWPSSEGKSGSGVAG